MGNAPQKRYLRDRSQKIMDAMDLLETKEIDVHGFLARTFELNNRFQSHDVFGRVQVEGEGEFGLEEMAALSVSDSSLSSNDSDISQISQFDVVQQNPCNVCLSNPKSVLLRPCNHLNVCDDCWNYIAQDAEAKGVELKSPTCTQHVTEAI